jgi:transmembrane sensor
MRSAEAGIEQVHVDQAIEWLVRLRYNAATTCEHESFEQWLQYHPHNVLAWQRVTDISDELSAVPRALARNTLEGSQRRRISRRDSLKVLALCVGAGGLAHAARDPLGLPSLLADQRTGTGERRTWTADDGSHIQLNTASALDVRFDASLRALSLIQGEVMINSARDPRPLQITTRDGSVQTLDSLLLVQQRQEGTLVAVRRGQVTVYARDGAALRLTQPGDQLLLSAKGTLRPMATRSDPWAWSEGVLSVQQMPLGDFIAELARYRPGVVRCAEAIAQLKVSGTYQLNDTDQILALLAKVLPVRISYHTRYWVSVVAA